MNKTWLIPLSVVIAAAVSPARADILDATFSGTVVTAQGGTAAVGSTVGGEFVYNTITSAFTAFTINGVSVAPGYASTATLLPSLTDVIFQAQVSPVQQGGTSNSSFAVDLSALNTFPNTSATAILSNSAVLAADVSTDPNNFPSTFTSYTANADGTNVVSLSADLTSIKVAVPEPASLALLSAASLGVVFWRRRRA